MVRQRDSQFAGCLIGQCLGDALGFIVEGYPPQECRRYVDEILNTGDVTNATRGAFLFGQYSDDSQLARELVRSFVACRRFEPADYAGRIAALFAENRVVGRGRATEEAAWRLAQGVSWEHAGTPAPAAGNGSAMRAGPIGLIFSDDPGRLIQAAHDQGRITHHDPRCSAGAVAVAGAVALALREDSITPATFAGQLADWVRLFDPILADALGQMERWAQESPEAMVARISRVGVARTYSDGWEGISPFVTSSVLWSVYAFLRSPDDYWDVICTSIGVGGDVDTTAAMAGAISGTRVGLEAIPPDLARRVNDNGTWRYSELVDLAHACLAIVEGVGTRDGSPAEP